MINYLSKFLPKASEITAPLRHLIKNSSEFKWEYEQDEALNKIKEMLCKAPTLKVFNPSLKTVIQCDSSKDGLGACLLQSGQPISFVSRS